MKDVLLGIMTYKVASVSLASLFALSMGANIWSVYKTSTFEATVQEQLEGKLSATATAISNLNEKVSTINSQMVSRDDLERRSDEIIRGLDEKTQRHIARYQSETGAKVDRIAVRFTRMETRLDKGISRIGGKLDSQRKTPPPPTSWKGVSVEDQHRCSDHPERCEPFQFSWESPFKVSGSPLARFSSPNIWGGQFALDLNLAFKVVTIGYGEDQSQRGAGAVQNQGVHIYAGYVGDNGFVPIAEQTLLKGNPNLDPKMFYVPQGDVIKLKSLRLFEPSFLVGSTYQGGEFGLSLGGSLLNLAKGQYRLGGNVIITESLPYVGAFVSYHHRFLDKPLNLAPSFGWVLGSDQSNTWSLGLQFQVW